MILVGIRILVLMHKFSISPDMCFVEIYIFSCSYANTYYYIVEMNLILETILYGVQTVKRAGIIA